MSSLTNGIQVLTPGVGYGIVVGIGAFFALMMLSLTYFQNRFTAYSTKQAEEFNTASRSVKPGLITAGIVSSWTWSATLLTSSTFAYSYGICGGMWYGAMGTFSIVVFSIIAIKIKANAAGAHTFPEIILSRHGHVAHLTYLFFGWATNMLVGACLVLGGSQVVAAMSGVNVYAACFLIPLVVAVYVIAGGLRSTFIADYTHSAILFIAILIFGFNVYTKSGPVGGLDAFYDLLVQASEQMPIAGNVDGSYLTFRSNNGLIFAMDLFFAGFVNVWLDQAYWQRAIASRPETAVKAYIAGGLAWYGIPFSFSTAMGLGCAALTALPSFPTYPHPLSAAQNGAGLSAPAAAVALLGKGGAGLMLLLLFMAVTSSTSAELIAVSSLLTFDVYKTYMRPQATNDELVRVSHYGIIIYAVTLAAFCCILNVAGIDLTWILTVLAIIVGGAAIPLGMILMWPRVSTIATIVAPWIALALSLITWLVCTKLRSGNISVATTGIALNALAGNIVSVVSGPLLTLILTYLFPWKYEATDPVAIARNEKIMGRSRNVGDASPPTAVIDMQNPAADTETGPDEKGSEKQAALEQPSQVANGLIEFHATNYIEPMDPEAIKSSTRLAIGFCIVFFLVAIVLVPFSLFGSGWVFSRAGFKGWCIVSFLWVWCSMFLCVFWPLIESRATILRILKGLVRAGISGGTAVQGDVTAV